MATSNALSLTSNMASFSLPAIGNLEAYISAVNRLPLLSPERETELGRKLRDQGDLDAARELILSHLRLVVSTARQYLGYGLPHADLIQEGNVGLMKAVKRFDPERGVRLVSFALHWIKAEIHEFILRNWRMVKVATTKAQRKLFFNLRSQKQELEKSASAQLTTAEVHAIAQRLNVREADVLEMDMRLSARNLHLSQVEAKTMSLLPRSLILQHRAQTLLSACRRKNKTGWRARAFQRPSSNSTREANALSGRAGSMKMNRRR